MAMTSNRPYLIRAFYDWIIDNQCTPYVAVDAFYPGVEVPDGHITDGQIVLNLAQRAVADFVMDNGEISFSTRFGGVPTEIRLPLLSVVAIYARENGQGMIFQPDDEPEKPDPKGPSPAPEPASKPSSGAAPTPKRGKLRVVK